MRDALTKEKLAAWAAAIEIEAMRDCYDGNDTLVFFTACEWLSRSANKLRPQEAANEPV